jgi:type II secretory pathway component PulF
VPVATESSTRKWSYKGRRATGEMVRGIVEAATHADAVRDIRRQGLAILEVELGDAKADVGEIIESFPEI